MSKKTLIMSFDDKGNLYPSIRPWMQNHPSYVIKTEEARDFTDTMEYDHLYDAYRGAARVKLVSSVTGRSYTMFLDDFDKVIKAKRFDNNQINGTFRFIKHGSSQAISLILENDAP